MEPELRKAIVKKVERDKREEFEALKYHDKGCSQRCRTKNDCLQKDLDRTAPMFEAARKFTWCDQCVNYEAVKVKYVCKEGCGRRFYAECVPIVDSYQKSQSTIEELKRKVK